MTSRDFVNRLLSWTGYRLERCAGTRIAGKQLHEDISILLGHKPQPVIFDLGANEGQSIREFLRDFRDPQIIAFEPCHDTFTHTQARFGRQPNVRLVRAAAGEADGEMELNVFARSGMNSLLPLEAVGGGGADGGEQLPVLRREKVPVRSLDSYCAEQKIPQIDILKMDCQGAELSILRGARRLLEEKRIQCLYLEVNFQPLYQQQATFEDYRQFLEPLGMGLGGIYKQAFRNTRLVHADVVFCLDQLSGKNGKEEDLFLRRREMPRLPQARVVSAG